MNPSLCESCPHDTDPNHDCSLHKKGHVMGQEGRKVIVVCDGYEEKDND